MNVEYFLKHYVTQRPLFLSLIRASEAFLYQKYLPLKSPILDVGCGDGFFAKTTFHLSIGAGLDMENSRIKEARKLNIYKKLVTYGGGKFPFPSRSFQTVISNCVLEHIDDLNLTIEEIYRVLKPGGIFFTTVMAKSWEDNLFGAKLFGGVYKKWMRKKQVHKNLFTREKWDKTFQKAGFRITNRVGYLSAEACQLIDICHYFSIPSLISHRLFGRWVLFPQIAQYIYPVKYLSRVLSEQVSADDSGAIFYFLRKAV